MNGCDSKLSVYIYLSDPLTIVLRTQLDIRTEAIVVKVTPREKKHKKGFIAESSGWRPPLHYAAADDFHHSLGTMRRGLCSSRLDRMNEETWSPATATLSKKFPLKLDDSLQGRNTHPGRSAASVGEGNVLVLLR